MKPKRSLVTSTLVMWLCSTVGLSTTVAVAAEPAPVQLALWTPIQLLDSDRSVRGARFSLMLGESADVVGLDLSTGSSRASGNVSGFQVALVHTNVEGRFSGIQLAGLAMAQGGTGLQMGIFGVDSRGGSMVGFQEAFVAAVADEIAGIQMAFGGTRATKVQGLQLSVFMSAADEVRGAQIGSLVQVADTVRGAQLFSLVNSSDNAAFQLGLLNFNKKGFLPFFPIVNFSVGH